MMSQGRRVARRGACVIAMVLCQGALALAGEFTTASQPNPTSEDNGAAAVGPFFSSDPTGPTSPPAPAARQTSFLAGDDYSAPPDSWTAVPDEPAANTSSLNWSPNSGNLLDGLSAFVGLDGSKQPQDLGVNALMGGRIAMNLGIPVIQEWGLGVQVGTAYNFSDNAVQVLHRLNVSDRRDQLYNTLGVFQRSDWGLNWSIAHDYLWESYYDNFHLGQWRARVGYQVTDTDEFGAWGTKADFGDSGSVLGVPIHLRPIQQVNAFWRHTWSSAAWTTLWIGGAKEHGRFVLVLPDVPAVRNAFVYGADLQMPLNDWIAIYGEANFITPASSGTVDAYLGFVFYPGGGARNALQKRFAPLLPTASNTSFAVDLPR
jgi:hypothetical protein